MTHRLRRADGFTLVELLIVMTVGLLLLSATLMTFERLVRNAHTNDTRQDTAELARRSLDIEARQLRNLAKRVNNVAVVNTVKPDDFVFQTSDPTRTWVRYCLDTSRGTDRGIVWEQTQAADTPGQTAACGPSAGGWGTSVVAAQSVVNRIDGRNQPMFTYRCKGGGTACTADPSTWDRIIGVDAALYVDTTPRQGSQELLVSSGVFLRNQNQAPKASMSATGVASAVHTVQLNASGSSDAEGRTLEYFWFLGTMPTNIRCDQQPVSATVGATTLWGGTLIGRGVVLQYQWTGAMPASPTFGLVACDPGDRYGFDSKIVPIP